MVESGVQAGLTDPLKKAHRAERIHLARVLGHVKGDAHVALGPQVVDLVGAHIPQHLVHGAGVVQVAVVEEEMDIFLVGVAIEVIHPACIEG